MEMVVTCGMKGTCNVRDLGAFKRRMCHGGLVTRGDRPEVVKLRVLWCCSFRWQIFLLGARKNVALCV